MSSDSDCTHEALQELVRLMRRMTGQVERLVALVDAPEPLDLDDPQACAAPMQAAYHAGLAGESPPWDEGGDDGS